jgi:DNA modification methylase
MSVNEVYHGDALSLMSQLDSKCVNTIVTSPPYFGLRDYGLSPMPWPEVRYTLFGREIIVPEQSASLGLERTPEAFIGHLVLIFRAAKDKLRDDGTLWLNIGDSYAGYHGNKQKADDEAPSNKNGYIENMRESTVYRRSVRASTLEGGKSTQANSKLAHESITTPGLKAKDLIGIPWMLAFALREDGWYLRQDIIWHKPNPMPESVTDRCTKAHEYIFLFSKNQRYYFDQLSIMTSMAQSSIDRLSQDIESQEGNTRVPGKTNGNMKASWNGSSFDVGKTGEMMDTRCHRK